MKYSNKIQARSLSKKTKNLYKLWGVEDGGHNNIEKAIQCFQSLNTYIIITYKKILDFALNIF